MEHREIKLTDKITFLVESTKETIKFPVEILHIDFKSKTAIIKCHCFKTSTAKKEYENLLAQHDLNVADFDKRFKDIQPKLIANPDGMEEQQLRKSLKEEGLALKDRGKKLKNYEHNSVCCPNSTFKVDLPENTTLENITDSNFLNELTNQIKI